MRDTDDIPLLTVKEAAKHAEVDVRTIARWIASGDLPTIPDPPRKLIRLDHLQRLLRRRMGRRFQRLMRHVRDA